MLDRLSIALRPRQPREAVDLGFALLRRHWRTVYGTWLLVMLPLAALLFLLFPGRPWLPPLLLWWLLPAGDRLVLHVLARATFGEVPSVRDTLRSAGAIFRRGAAAGLLWRRFSFSRGLLLPVWQLEGQDGAGYRRRAPVLLRRGRAQAWSFALACRVFRFGFFAALLGAIGFFAPLGRDGGFLDKLFAAGPRHPAVDLITAGLAAAGYLLLEPCYVAGSFGLYLNRRVQLEGWDLELAFRRLAERLRRAAATGAALLLLAGFCLAARPLRAGAPPKAPATPQQALREVMAQPEFQTERVEDGWHWKQAPARAEKPRRQLDLGWLFVLLGSLLKWGLIAAAAAFILYLLWRHRAALGAALSGQAPYTPPDQLFGLDIRPESLPEDLPAAALSLWRRGRCREALGLLYRGALANLVHRHRLPVPAGATEGDCLGLALPALAEGSGGYLRELTSAWQSVAYGGVAEPEGGERLCLDWPSHFDAKAGKP